MTECVLHNYANDIRKIFKDRSRKIKSIVGEDSDRIRNIVSYMNKIFSESIEKYIENECSTNEIRIPIDITHILAFSEVLNAHNITNCELIEIKLIKFAEIHMRDFGFK